ncbi:MAG TPA: protein kinase, partial [Myxococcota bacterium]|nr:protein kinase [Myxococcota bacterium]
MRVNDVVAERFELLAVAGQGGMGTVWRARDRVDGALVALKVLADDDAQDSAAERFVRETQVLAALRHPGIVRYVASGRTPESGPWMAMEWLEGEDLTARLQRGRLPVAQAVELVRQAAAAVGAAHARGIVHRDLKPSNLLLAGGDVARVKVVDFGVARDATRATLTQTGTLVGTPGYMAPEQVRGEAIDPRADVFSLGCVLFECLTGRPPFVADHMVALLFRIVVQEPEAPSELCAEVPPALDAFVARLMAKEPAARPDDGAAVATALEAVLDGESAWTEHPTGETRRGVPAAPRRPPSSGLTRAERRIVCLVLATPPRRAAAAAAALDPTVDAAAPSGVSAPLATLAGRLGARVEQLPDGSVLGVLDSGGSAADLAARAVRWALALRAEQRDAAVSVCTGRTPTGRSAPFGPVLDRATSLARAGGPHVRVDETTAGLLDSAFVVGGDADGLVLAGESDTADPSRTLLGRPAPFVGRTREMSLLSALYDECVEESLARAALVLGAAGAGKSRLRHELVQALAHGSRPPQIWLGRADSVAAGAPLGMIAQAVRGACGALEGEPAEVRRRKLRARAGRHLGASDQARVAEFLGEACGAPFPDEDSVQLRAARRDPVLMGDQVQRAFEDLIDAEAASGPLLLVLEDLHWSDNASVTLVDRLLRNLAHRPLFVLGAGRPETTTIFPRLWAERAVTHVALGRLLGRAARALVQATLGDAATEQRVQRIVDRADGNAFFLEELIRAAAEGRWDHLPETVVAVAEARLAGLEPEARRLLRAASVFGLTFPAAALGTLLGEPSAHHDTEAWLQTLCERELLVPAAAGRAGAAVAEVGFRHAFLREAAYAMLTEEDRRLGHRLAGSWLEGRGGAEARAVAEHFELGQDRAAAGRWWGRAAADALRANDLAGAVGHAERAVVCGAAGESLGALRALQADAQMWRGDNAACEQAAHEALTLLPPGAAAWFRVAMRLGTVMTRLGRGADLEALAASVRPVPPCDGAARLARATGLAVLASNLFISGRHAPAEALLEDVAPAARAFEAHEPGVGSALHTALGSRALASADLEGYARAQERAVELQQVAGNLRGEAVARTSLGHARLELGLNAAAEVDLRAAEAICERMGLLSV